MLKHKGTTVLLLSVEDIKNKHNKEGITQAKLQEWRNICELFRSNEHDRIVRLFNDSQTGYQVSSQGICISQVRLLMIS